MKMRRTINISFPNDLYVFVQDRAHDGAYASTSEYIRALVRADRERSEGKAPRPAKEKRTRQANDYFRNL